MGAHSVADVSVLILILALASIAALVACILLYRRVRQHEQRYQALVSVLRGEIEAITNSSIGMGRRVIAVERKLSATVEKQEALENRDPGAVAYNQASRLMEMGANVDDLVESCGIGRPEAELLALLHRELKATDRIGRD